MAFLDWTDAYSVNVKEMDEQHKKLVQLINGFYDALQEDIENKTIPSLFAGVVDYTKVHFSEEEELMRKNGFPDYETHKAEHDDFAMKVLDARAKYEEGDKNVIGKLALMLGSWLMDHIVMKDKKYGAYCNGKGVF